MTPKKPEWFEMTEDGDSYSGIQKVNKKLPIAVASKSASGVNSLPVPTVSNVLQRGDDDDHEDRDDD